MKKAARKTAMRRSVNGDENGTDVDGIIVMDFELRIMKWAAARAREGLELVIAGSGLSQV